jgi:hypothetical protein
MNARLNLFGAVSAAILAPATASALPSDCDEACLLQMADTFLGAVAAHDASLIEWNAYARWTLNGVELPFSEAVWALENEVSDAHRIVIPDVEAGEVGIITSWTFDGTPSLMAARLKVEWARLSEAEMIVVTQPAPPPTPPGTPPQPAPPGPQFAELGAPNPLFGETADQPESREALIAVADAYFDGVAADSPASVADDCARMENANPSDTCGDAGIFAPATEVAPRRYIADPSRGVVFAVARYNDDGVASERAPGSVLTGQMVKIVDGEVVAVEAVGERVFYYLPIGWGEK